jgi:hypothetical protein
MSAGIRFTNTLDNVKKSLAELDTLPDTTATADRGHDAG